MFNKRTRIIKVEIDLNKKIGFIINKDCLRYNRAEIFGKIITNFYYPSNYRIHWQYKAIINGYNFFEINCLNPK